MRVSKDEAVARLRAANKPTIAAQLNRWHSKLGNNWGWDGWFRGRFPTLVPIIWA